MGGGGVFVAVGILALALAVSAERLCLASDYVAEYGACEGEKRTRMWALPANRTCRASGKFLKIDGGSVGCECQLEDYTPVYDTDCGEDGLVTYSLNSLSSCTAPAAIVDKLCPSDDKSNCGKTLCQCSEDDIGTTFTPCVAGTRKLTSFWKKRCEPGALKLPAPSASHSCYETCGVGEILAPPHETCTSCPAGKTSTMDVVHSPPWTDKFPHGFYTHCKSDPTCSQWTLETDYIATRPTIDEADLRLWLDVKTIPAYLSFSYRIVGKVFDATGRLTVYVNGMYVYSDTEQDDWITVTFDLLDREHCLWEVRDKNKNTYCLKANHILPYVPAMALDTVGPFTKKDGDSEPLLHQWSDTFIVQKVVNWEDPCEMVEPHITERDGHWVALIQEVTQPSNFSCNWEEAAVRAQSLGAAAIIFHTSSELLSPNTRHTDKISIPVVYLREQFSDQDFASITSFEFKRNDYKEGITEVIFMYDKIADADSSSSAHIRDITVHGTKIAPTECVDCPRGTFSKQGSGCEPCPEGYYQNEEGMDMCKPCDGEVMQNGAHCLELSMDCTQADYVPHVGECLMVKCSSGEAGCLEPKRSVTYYPVDCKVSPGNAPAEKLIDCEACPVGQRKVDEWKCVECGSGEQLLDTGVCELCSGETAALKQLSYPESSKWIPRQDGHLCDGSEGCEWSKECTEGVSRKCWMAEYKGSTEEGTKDYSSPQMLTNGEKLRDVAKVSHRLVYDAQFISNVGEASFSYKVDAPVAADLENVQVRFSVYSVDEGVDLLVYEDIANAEATTVQKTTVSNLSGKVQFHWEYLKDKKTTADVVFTLLTFNVTWLASGDATECAACPAGMECSGGVPQMCPAGHTSENGKCVACAEDTFSSFAGSPSCLSCPEGMNSVDSKTRCEVPGCKWLFKDPVLGRLSYDLHNLGVQGKFIVRGEKKDPAEYTVRLCPAGDQSYAVKDERTGRGAVNLGRKVGVERRDVDGTRTLRVEFEDGDRCLDSKGTRSRMSSTVDLICDTEGGATVIEIHDTMFKSPAVERGPCNTHFYVVSPNACPACSSHSWMLVNLACVNGTQQQTYTRKPGHEGCIATTTPDLPTPRPCNSIDNEHTGSSSGAITAVIIITVLVLAGLGGLAFALYKRNIALKVKYSKVSTRASASAMHQQMGGLNLDSVAEDPRSPGEDGEYHEEGDGVVL